VAFVDPLIGSDGNGNTFPGADVPFGAVQFSPVTLGGGTGGYRYSEGRLRGFAVTRLSGMGCTNYGDLPLLPVAGPPAMSAAAAPGEMTVAYSHRQEIAQPGSYQVKLRSGVSAALTVTTRTGLAVFTYPASARRGTLLLDPSGAANAKRAVIRLLGDGRVVGSATSAAYGGPCGHARGRYTLHFALAFDRPMGSFGTWVGRRVEPGSRARAGRDVGAFVSFDTRRQHVVRVKVGVSFVSVANALLNLGREGQSWSFQAVQARARARWQRLLSQIQVHGGSPAAKKIFYSALYHSLLAPSVFSDANGQYLGRDGRIRVAEGYTRYANFSGWDIYRSQIPLLALLVPHETSDMIRSLVVDGAEAGQLSKWLLANVETNLQIGDPGDAIISGAYAFGARDFDAALALHEMLRGATSPTPPVNAASRGYLERPALAQYLARGYIAGRPATTLEYAIADFAIAQLATALGDQADATASLARSGSWRNTFNPRTGFVGPRLGDGSYPDDFDPTSGKGFVEGNAWQYTLMVPQDMGDLLAAIGPRAAVIHRLDGFFAKLNAGPDTPHAWLGNEPSFAAPFAYLWLGAPARTEEVVQRAQRTLFTTKPDGLPGNDDLGAISSWYVWTALGLYPAIPAVGGLAVFGPQFPRVTITLGTGKQIKLATAGSGPYIQALTVNRIADNSSWLPLDAITGGAGLIFTLSRAPTSWATTPQSAPPSFHPTG
jgi:predicted alpha-1,2-mannosidase